MKFADRKHPSILVVGLGSIGRRHATNLRALGVQRIVVCDSDPRRLEEAKAEFAVSGFGDLQEALDATVPDAVIVCTPPTYHIAQARLAVRGGAHVFVEKPLSHSLQGVDDLIREATATARVIQVGYNFRFHTGLQLVKKTLDDGAIGRMLWARAEVGQYLPEWRPRQDYRASYTARRSMGGGIILDSSHEIDYLRWLIGEIDQVYCVAGRLSDLDVDVEDTASMIVRFATGAVGEIHVDFVQRIRARNCKIVGDRGTVHWDNWDASVDIFTVGDGRWQRVPTSGGTNDKYLAEMSAFLSCLDGSREPVVTATSARSTLKVALAALRSAETNRPVDIGEPETHR